MDHKQKFTELLEELHSRKSKNSKSYTESEYKNLVERLKKLSKSKPTVTDGDHKDYYIIKKYSLKRVDTSYIILNKKTHKILVHMNELFDILNEAHQLTKHGGRDAVTKLLNEKYSNITKEIVSLFIKSCENCHLKRNKVRKVTEVEVEEEKQVKPIVLDYLNSRCQVDLIDLQFCPDADYKFIFVYKDHLTKFLRLRPTKTKTAKEVAYNLLDIFAEVGIPCVLQSDSGREFARQIIEELVHLWPQSHIVHGKLLHSEHEESGETERQDIKSKLISWMKERHTAKWSEGLRFVQLDKNRCFHSEIGKSPYEALFGVTCKDGLNNLPFPLEKIKMLRSEEDIEMLLISSNHIGIKNEESDTNEELDDASSANEATDVDDFYTILKKANILYSLEEKNLLEAQESLLGIPCKTGKKQNTVKHETIEVEGFENFKNGQLDELSQNCRCL